MSEFVSADTIKIGEFERQSAEAIQEFDAIKKAFENTNTTMLSKWKGAGAAAYKQETDHILENIGGIKDILDTINEGAVKDIRENYSKLDEDLADFNRNPQQSGEE